MNDMGRHLAVFCLAFLVLAAQGAADDAPFCALRFGFRYTQPDKWPEMRAALAKNRAAFDEVWFSTGVTFPPLAWHEEHARQCALAADDLRKLGIVPSIEIQAIIGHTDSILDAGDCSGQDWGTMVSADGLAAKRLSCPQDPKLVAYFVRVAELHAAWKPGSVWVDDDLSYRNRAPVKKPENRLAGCFCDRCVSGFSAKDGRAWPRDELVAAIRRDESVRRRWDDYSCGVMGELTRAIAAAVHRISPETVMGYQYGGVLQPAIPRGLFNASGLPVRLRPGAGAYWDADAHEQLAKAYGLQHMLLNGRDVTKEIRLPQISMYASAVSAHPAVRAFLLEMQQQLARTNSVIMDGRDIGTVVLPDADVKIFLTASPEARAQRRMLELEQRGTPEPFEVVLKDIQERDWNDSHRAAAPLRQAEDAVLLDTTELTFAESEAALLQIIKEKTK